MPRMLQAPSPLGGEGWDEGVTAIQLKLSNPLTPTLSPLGRGSALPVWIVASTTSEHGLHTIVSVRGRQKFLGVERAHVRRDRQHFKLYERTRQRRQRIRMEAQVARHH